MTIRKSQYAFTILSEPASKANSRRLFRRGHNRKSHPVIIKSQKALDYIKNFNLQCPTLNPLFESDVEVEMTIFYASRRPDLDESVILDAMQDRIYKNDRQVKSKIIRWGLSKSNPRAEIKVRPLKKPPLMEGA